MLSQGQTTNPMQAMQSYSFYLDWIDTQAISLLQRVKQWVAINTHSTHTSGLSKLLQLLEKDFQCLGGRSEYITLTNHPILSAEGKFKPHALGQAISIRKRPEAPIQVLLAGHYDTVFAPHSPFQTPHETEDGILKGPGTADMKGGLSILLTALEALERSSFAGNLGWEILITPDEEIGSPGSTILYETAAARHQVGLIFEPAYPDGAFVSERKGSANFSVIFKGRAAHVGRDFLKGRSAVFAIARFINLIQHIEGKDLIINVADLESKGPVNIVPHLASCRINLRSSDVKSLTHATTTIHRLAKLCTEKEGLEFEIIKDSYRPPKLFDQKTQNLFKAYESCATALNIPFQTRETGGVCDGNILAGAGLPTLDTAGAVGGGLHTHDEYLLISSLIERSKLAALFLLKLASKEIILEKGVSHD